MQFNSCNDIKAEAFTYSYITSIIVHHTYIVHILSTFLNCSNITEYGNCTALCMCYSICVEKVEISCDNASERALRRGFISVRIFLDFAFITFHLLPACRTIPDRGRLHLRGKVRKTYRDDVIEVNRRNR